jgi:hypothetical protein
MLNTHRPATNMQPERLNVYPESFERDDTLWFETHTQMTFRGELYYKACAEPKPRVR